jgi:ribose 1,5-bisphosphokinase
LSQRRGLFVAVVGPSGAGKDSLIRALAERLAGDPDFIFVRRCITRPPDAHEDHAALDPAEFEAQAQRGRFALLWRAHGLSYGVPIEVDAALRQGKVVVCNLSRAAVAEARRRWPEVWVALVTAAPETLAARLAARGREPPADRSARLDRAAAAEVAIDADAIIDNDGDLAQAAERLYALLQTRRKVIA